MNIQTIYVAFLFTILLSNQTDLDIKFTPTNNFLKDI